MDSQMFGLTYFHFLRSINGLKFFDTCSKAKFKDTALFFKRQSLNLNADIIFMQSMNTTTDVWHIAKLCDLRIIQI